MKYQPLNRLAWKSAAQNTLGFACLLTLIFMGFLSLMALATPALGQQHPSKLILHVDVWCATLDGTGCESLDTDTALRRVGDAAAILGWPREKWVAHLTGNTRTLHCQAPTRHSGMECGVDQILDEIRHWDKGAGHFIVVVIVGPATSAWANDLYGQALYPFAHLNPHWTESSCALWAVGGSDLWTANIAHELGHCMGIDHYTDDGQIGIMGERNNLALTHLRPETVTRISEYFEDRTPGFSMGLIK